MASALAHHVAQAGDAEKMLDADSQKSDESCHHYAYSQIADANARLPSELESVCVDPDVIIYT